MKIACATQSKRELKRFTNFLSKEYEIQSQDESLQKGLYRNIYTLKESPDLIEEMFSLLIAATGVEPRKGKSKKQKIVRVRRAASYLLYSRFGLSHTKVAKLMGYASHVSSLLFCRDMKHIEVKNVPIELAIRKCLDYSKITG